jgi:hypothetical protein
MIYSPRAKDCLHYKCKQLQIAIIGGQVRLSPTNKTGGLAEAQSCLDEANARLNRRFAQAVDAFADGGPQLVGHEFFGRSILGQWLKII